MERGEEKQAREGGDGEQDLRKINNWSGREGETNKDRGQKGRGKFEEHVWNGGPKARGVLKPSPLDHCRLLHNNNIIEAWKEELSAYMILKRQKKNPNAIESA